MEITELRSKLKDRLALGLNYGIQSLEESLDGGSPLRNDLVACRSQYNDLNRLASLGTLGYEQVEIGYNKLRRSLLEIIDRVEGTDLTDPSHLPKVQSNDLQHRKENFFELVKLHLKNLDAVTLTQEISSGDRQRTEVNTGREAFALLYRDVFKQRFKYQRGDQLSIQDFSRVFFEKYFPTLEVYMKTLGFVLRYVQQEEVEQAFFNGVVRSLLSTNEVVFMAYYAISGIEPGFAELLHEAGIVEERHWAMLVEEGHRGLLPAS